MAENLQNEASEWKTGESDPADFTGDAVAEVLKSADEEEVKRVQGADERKGVQSAAESRLKALADEDADDEDDSDDSDDDSSEDEDDNKQDPSETDGLPDPVKSDDLPDPSADDYDALQDPSVPSSVIAEAVMQELKGSDGKKSPTLDTCRDAYKDRQKS